MLADVLGEGAMMPAWKVAIALLAALTLIPAMLYSMLRIGAGIGEWMDRRAGL